MPTGAWQGLQRFGGPFLTGERFNAVDAFFCPVAIRLQTYGLALGGSCDGYAQRLRALPAMQLWYAAALREPVPDARRADLAQWRRLPLFLWLKVRVVG